MVMGYLSHLIRVPPPMDDRAVSLPWDKKFVLTPLGQAVVYGELRKIYKRIQRYPSGSIPPGTDTEKSSMGGYPC